MHACMHESNACRNMLTRDFLLRTTTTTLFVFLCAYYAPPPRPLSTSFEENRLGKKNRPFRWKCGVSELKLNFLPIRRRIREKKKTSRCDTAVCELTTWVLHNVPCYCLGLRGAFLEREDVYHTASAGRCVGIFSACMTVPLKLSQEEMLEKSYNRHGAPSSSPPPTSP